eukprot:scaffold30038_cov18-Prasinocladus_malaysianus.AAC.1
MDERGQPGGSCEARLQHPSETTTIFSVQKNFQQHNSHNLASDKISIGADCHYPSLGRLRRQTYNHSTPKMQANKSSWIGLNQQVTTPLRVLWGILLN